jgi:hypothetical protein
VCKYAHLVIIQPKKLLFCGFNTYKHGRDNAKFHELALQLAYTQGNTQGRIYAQGNPFSIPGAQLRRQAGGILAPATQRNGKSQGI